MSIGCAGDPFVQPCQGRLPFRLSQLSEVRLKGRAIDDVSPGLILSLLFLRLGLKVLKPLPGLRDLRIDT